jgi:hypothetical protein
MLPFFLLQFSGGLMDEYGRPTTKKGSKKNKFPFDKKKG